MAHVDEFYKLPGLWQRIQSVSGNVFSSCRRSTASLFRKILEEVSRGPGRFFIETEGKKTSIPAHVWFLRACGEQTPTEEGQRDVLRNDQDAIHLYKNEIQCICCKELIVVKDRNGCTTVVEWVHHKLTCRGLL